MIGGVEQFLNLLINYNNYDNEVLSPMLFMFNNTTFDCPRSLLMTQQGISISEQKRIVVFFKLHSFIKYFKRYKYKSH